MFLVVCHLLLLLALECTHALKHLVPIDQCAVELRAVNAHKLCLATDGKPAGTTHASAVNHDGVKRHIGWYAMLLASETCEFHHDGGTNAESLIDMRFLLDELLNTDGNNTFLAV